MKKLALVFCLGAGLFASGTTPVQAWVAVGGYHGCAVGYRPPCCYGGAAVAGAVVAGAMVGAAVASSAQPPPAPVYVAAAPPPVYYGAPVGYAPPVGTIVATLPGACTSVNINAVSYMNCSGVYYLPYYSGGSLLFQVTVP